MRMKIIVVLSVVVLMGGGVIAARKMVKLSSYQLQESQQARQGQTVPREQTLRWYVEQTKAKGENEIILNAPFIDYPGNSISTHIDDALSSFTTVIAEPTKEEVVALNSGEILTWYKFQILDLLSKKDTYGCADCPKPPEDFLPITENQFVMAQYGGTVTIDGVKLTMLDPSFPRLELRKQYLLFISRSSSGVATIGVGPNGVFGIDNGGIMTPINGNPHPIKDDVNKRFGKSLDKVRVHARQVLK